jgi:uncharacterized protein YciI
MNRRRACGGEEAATIAADDPAVRAGLLTVRVRPWTRAFA